MNTEICSKRLFLLLKKKKSLPWCNVVLDNTLKTLLAKWVTLSDVSGELAHFPWLAHFLILWSAPCNCLWWGGPVKHETQCCLTLTVRFTPPGVQATCEIVNPKIGLPRNWLLFQTIVGVVTNNNNCPKVGALASKRRALIRKMKVYFYLCGITSDTLIYGIFFISFCVWKQAQWLQIEILHTCHR